MANSAGHNIDNSMKNVSNVFETLIENLQLVIDQIKGGESKNETPADFTLKNYWTKLEMTVKAISTECTKLSMAFSQPPVPASKDCKTLVSRIEGAVLSTVSAFYALPKSQGLTLRRSTLNYIISVITAVHTFALVVLQHGCQGSRDQLQSTGNVWECCDDLPNIPKDNKEAVLVGCRESSGLIRDALEEIEEAQKNENDGHHWDDLEEALHDPDQDILEGPCWSDSDRKLLGPSVGLLKVARSCGKKMTMAVKTNGQCETEEQRFQLDDLADCVKGLSPAVDELASCLYPPMRHSAVRENADNLGQILRQLLEISKNSHFTVESDATWVDFLTNALQHNLDKISELVHNAT